ncbi:MAG TPA: multicopper oxidase domain-containing protein [Candidatus Bathyarchaeia archaeon]|nr:multicopper oxidase domain-containing protein [Candidatus Bathyarchaeia archaeon]
MKQYIARTNTGHGIIVHHQHQWQEPKLTALPESPRKPRFGFDTLTKSRRRLVAVMLALLLIGGVTGFYVSQISFPKIVRPVLAQGFRDYTLVAQPKDIQVTPGPPGATWHAWTYNGTVPGPILKAKVGEILRITLVNNLNLKHSVHTHLAPYRFEFDGSQANVITGTGAAGMVAPGQQYTYEFQLTAAGLFYYHCHSSDGGRMINEHMLQGLYGVIVVDEPDAQPIRDNAIFMGEIGFDVTGLGASPYVMNGLGIPGGEMTLEQIFASRGIQGVLDQFNKTLPAFNATVGETIRFHIVNIGNQQHSFHLHGINMVSQLYFPGRVWPANVIQLVSGGADSIIIRPQYAGVWLFHCHVVQHADLGMIGVLQVV